MRTADTRRFHNRAKRITLDSLAAAQDRPRSYLINEAITNYIELHAYRDALVRKGLEEMRKARVVSHEEVVKRLKQTGRARRLSSRLSGNDRMDRAGAPAIGPRPRLHRIRKQQRSCRPDHNPDRHHHSTARRFPHGRQIMTGSRYSRAGDFEYTLYSSLRHRS
jgi:predicted transcriptional regulator